MAQGDLPRWQLESIYPSGDPAPYEVDAERVRNALTELERYMDEHGVDTDDKQHGVDADDAKQDGDATDRAVDVLTGLLARLEAAYLPFLTMRAYVSNRMAVNAADEQARRRRGPLELQGARLDALNARVTAYMGTLPVEALIAASPTLADNAYLLRRTARGAKHLMGQQAESLAAALDLSGGVGWEQLHDDLVSTETITAAIEPTPDGLEEGERPYGIAELFVFRGHPDPGVREAAHRAELALLGRHRTAYAAAMNGIKGQVAELATRRGWSSPLDASLFDYGIDRDALGAMQSACAEYFPVLRRYLGAKARALGKPRLPWQDLYAPLGHGEERGYTWEEAKAFVIERFGTFSERLAGFAARAFEQGWVDVPPRAGKRNGAFCSAIVGRKESRVMLNFGGRLDDVFTVAHELGHAYHNDCMYAAGRCLLQSDSPMTLAETASIFCETLVLDAMLGRSDPDARLAILEQDLQSAAGLVLDIHSRFLFESAVFERRPNGPLAPDELDQIMLDAQAASYGEAEGAELRHPLMWAQKPHYYSSSTSFYNYPYTFGYLFGLGLFAVYQADKPAFVKRYDTLLASTGMASPAELAKGFGMDITDPGFWRASLDVIARRVDAFEELVGTPA